MDLTSFQHSLFLSALGNAILNSLWQGFLLWIIYETVIISYKKTDAKFKHNLSVLFIFCSFIWFICTFILKLQVTENITSFVSGTNNLETLDKPKSSFFNIFLSFISNILPYLSVAYIMLLFFLMTKLFAAYGHVHFITHKNLINPPEHLETFASKVALQIAIPKKLKIWISNHIEVPATIGFIKPVILIPFASINQLTVYQLEAIILHELSHIKRNDYLVNLLISVIETILFFNPFIFLLVKTIKRERENCCDDFVLQYRYDPHSYASALLRLEQSRKNNVQLSLGAVSGKKQLLFRIKRITGTNTVNQFNYGQKLAALLLTTAIFCSIAWLAPKNVKKEVKNIPEKKNANIFATKSESTVIPKIKAIENDPGKIEISKNNQPEENNQLSINNSDISEAPDTNSSGEDEKNIIIDENSSNDLASTIQKPISELNKINFKSFILKNIPKFKVENLSIKINGELNKGIKQAYEEINKINWTKVQSDINKSFSKIKIDQLSENQKSEIIKARKYLSLINLDKQEFNATKVLHEIQQQQKLIADSIKAAGTTLINQQPARLAENYKVTELQNGNNSTSNFVFSYNSKPDRRNLFKRNKTNANSEEHTIQLNGEKLKINIQTTPSNNKSSSPLTKKVKKSQHIIIEI